MFSAAVPGAVAYGTVTCLPLAAESVTVTDASTVPVFPSVTVTSLTVATLTSSSSSVIVVVAVAVEIVAPLGLESVTVKVSSISSSASSRIGTTNDLLSVFPGAHDRSPLVAA